jgi:hypothetical protein
MKKAIRKKRNKKLDNLGDLMQNYNFSIVIQEHNQEIKVKGFSINLN